MNLCRRFTFYSLSIIFLLCLLGACGFKLRGKWYFNQQINPLLLHVAEEGNQLTLCLVNQLTHAGIQLLDHQGDRTASLIIRDIKASKVQMSDNQLSTKEYELKLTATANLIQLDSGKSVQLLPVETLASTRRVVQDTNQVNASLAEENVLFADLQADICWQIMRYLQSLNP